MRAEVVSARLVRSLSHVQEREELMRFVARALTLVVLVFVVGIAEASASAAPGQTIPEILLGTWEEGGGQQHRIVVSTDSVSVYEAQRNQPIQVIPVSDCEIEKTTVSFYLRTDTGMTGAVGIMDGQLSPQSARTRLARRDDVIEMTTDGQVIKDPGSGFEVQTDPQSRVFVRSAAPQPVVAVLEVDPAVIEEVSSWPQGMALFTSAENPISSLKDVLTDPTMSIAVQAPYLDLLGKLDQLFKLDGVNIKKEGGKYAVRVMTIGNAYFPELFVKSDLRLFLANLSGPEEENTIVSSGKGMRIKLQGRRSLQP